jgi:hypothetical protein
VTVPLARQEGSLEVGHKPIDLVRRPRPDPVGDADCWHPIRLADRLAADKLEYSRWRGR